MSVIRCIGLHAGLKGFMHSNVVNVVPLGRSVPNLLKRNYSRAKAESNKQGRFYHPLGLSRE